MPLEIKFSNALRNLKSDKPISAWQASLASFYGFGRRFSSWPIHRNV